jgi:hypothetical protein
VRAAFADPVKPFALGKNIVSVVTCLPHITRHQQSSSATLRDEPQGALSFIRRHKVNLLTCNILFSGTTECGEMWRCKKRERRARPARQ